MLVDRVGGIVSVGIVDFVLVLSLFYYFYGWSCELRLLGCGECCGVDLEILN